MSTHSAPPSASSRVLQVTELLEAVLMQLDVRTLLVSAQRVNKRWYNVIGNTDLQKKLFLVPDHDATARKKNELLLEIFPFCFPMEFKVEGNPDRKISTSNTRLYHYQLFTNYYGRHLSWTEWVTFRDRADGFSRVDASWRRMLTHQPPLMAIIRSIRHPAHGTNPPRTHYQDCFDVTVHMSTIIQHAFAPEESFGPTYTDNFPQGRKTKFGVFDTSWPNAFVKKWAAEEAGPHQQAYISYFIDRNPSDGPCPKFAGIAKILLPRKSLGEKCSRFLKSIGQTILGALIWLLGRL